jgi:parallel beta helix pectate lyase-like protein
MYYIARARPYLTKEIFMIRPIGKICFLSMLLLSASVAANAISFRSYVSVNGNDANTSADCALMTPCRSFGAALTVTSLHGEVVAIDTGDYMSVNITQSVTLKTAPGVDATIVAMGGDGISINAGPNDNVVIRGLTVNGAFGFSSAGIHFWSGGTLNVENCVITDFFFSGLIMDGAGRLAVSNTVLRNGPYGVILQSNPGTIHAVLDHVQVTNNTSAGIDVRTNARATVRNSVFAHSATGVQVSAPFNNPAVLIIEDCFITDNQQGVLAQSPSTIIVSSSTITDNGTGLVAYGTLLSFGNNRLSGNSTDGTFTGVVPLQ